MVSFLGPIGIVAGLAGLAESREGGLDRVDVAAVRRPCEGSGRLAEFVVLRCEIVGLLPDLRLGAGLAEVRPGAGREPVPGPGRKLVDDVGVGPDDPNVGIVLLELRADRLRRLADLLHPLMPVVHELQGFFLRGWRRGCGGLLNRPRGCRLVRGGRFGHVVTDLLAACAQ